jgi:uncharacterized protein (DUF58 family)
MLRSSRLSTSTPDLKLEAKKLAETLPALILAAEHLANAYDLGVHGRRRTGTGEDFWQFKQYGPDDATSSIDWRQSAKREHLYIRQKEQETSETVWFWVDKSATMDYSSGPGTETKLARSKILTLALALLLSKGGEKYGLLGHSEKAVSGPASFNTFAADVESDKPLSLQKFQHSIRIPQKATVLLISDFLAPPEQLGHALEAFVDAGCNGIVLHVADPAEVDLPFTGRTRFEGKQAEDSLIFGRVEALRADYKDVFQNHKSRISRLTNAVSWEYVFHRTDVPASRILSDIYSSLRVKGV